MEKIRLKKTMQILRAPKAFCKASYCLRALSPVFWGHLQVPSPVPELMIEYRAMCVARIVDEVFFP